jgi:NTE family protein
MVLRSYDLMSERIANERLAGFAPDILVQVSREQCGIYDFHKAEELVEAGRRAAIRQLGPKT